MKVIKQIIADEGKVVSTDGVNYGKVVWCQEGQQTHEISEEEWQEILNQRQAENEEDSGMVQSE